MLATEQAQLGVLNSAAPSPGGIPPSTTLDAAPAN